MCFSKCSKWNFEQDRANSPGQPVEGKIVPHSWYSYVVTNVGLLCVSVVLVSLLFVNFEHISHLVLVFLLLTLNIILSEDCSSKRYCHWYLLLFFCKVTEFAFWNIFTFYTFYRYLFIDSWSFKSLRVQFFANFWKENLCYQTKTIFSNIF